MKKFNVTGTCYPDKHYMVDISHTLDLMQEMVDDGKYFTINRGRQYGKTTTLSLLKKRLEGAGYTVFSISFQGLDDEVYATSESFYRNFFQLLYKRITYGVVSNLPKELPRLLEEYLQPDVPMDGDRADLLISRLCSLALLGVVLLVDEVDQAGNYDVFLRFLGLLREKFLNREEIPTFQSVILAGVYDIKNLKLKIRDESEHQYNSPWNIAVGFTSDMSLSEEGIRGMLSEYEADHHTGMDVPGMAKLLRDYTSGYPFLVSRLCQIMDEELPGNAWNEEGFQAAVKAILQEENTLFDDVSKKLDQFRSLHDMLYDILYTGERKAFDPDDKAIHIASMFGYIRKEGGSVAISNRILEMRLYNRFVTEASMRSDEIYTSGSIDKNRFIKDGRLDMKLILERFIVHYNDIYGDRDEKFHEKEGRKYFLFYLKPIINGTGNYYVEAETRDETRTDVVVDYLGKQYVVELKIWRGNSYNEEGEKQLSEYLDYFHLDTGYMLSFNFNKNKQPGVHERKIGGKTLIEAVV